MSKSIKLLVLFFIVFSSNSFGDNKKNKDLPPGLQKKVERGGELPHGWKKKLRKGYTLDSNVFSHGVILKGRYPSVPGTSVYRIDDKIIRLSIATREIIDILK